jgi:hypothetical protein
MRKKVTRWQFYALGSPRWIPLLLLRNHTMFVDFQYTDPEIV